VSTHTHATCACNTNNLETGYYRIDLIPPQVLNTVRKDLLKLWSETVLHLSLFLVVPRNFITTRKLSRHCVLMIYKTAVLDLIVLFRLQRTTYMAYPMGYEISCSRCCEVVDVGLVGSNSLWICRKVPTFPGRIPPLYSVRWATSKTVIKVTTLRWVLLYLYLILNGSRQQANAGRAAKVNVNLPVK
jgi:hypothetical protein